MQVIRHERETNAPLRYTWSVMRSGAGAGGGDLVELGARALVGLLKGLLLG